jgi:hypothetical protein
VNLALPVLLLLSAAPVLGFAVRRRRPSPVAVAWGVVGLAVTALFAPALALPDGIPSPSASLAEHAPWSGADDLDGFTGNPVMGDVTYQIEPWLLFSRRELRAGRLPLWNPHQFSGTPFWANGQSAPLHPLHLLFAALPAGLLPLGWILLPWLRLVVAGLGARALARCLGVGETGALYAALAFALSGMLVGFALYPMGNALALVPWVLAATERLVGRWEDGAGGSSLAGLAGATGWLAAAVGLQLLGGHPATAVHTGVLSVLFLIVRLGPRRLAGAAPRLLPAWTLAWIVGAAVAAVHLAPFAALLGETSRWQGFQAGSGGGEPWWLSLVQPLRLVLPDLYGNPAAGTWWGPFNYLATAVYAGALALPLAAAGLLARGDGARGRRALAGCGLFALAAAYHLPGLHDLMTVLPVVGRAPSHRLIFAVILTLAVLGGAGLERWRDALGDRLDPASRRRVVAGLAGGAVLALGLLTVATALYRGDWDEHGLVAEQVMRTSAVALGALGLLGAAVFVRRRRSTGTDWIGAGVLAFVALDLMTAHAAVHLALPASALYPETGAVRALAGSKERVIATGSTLRPNAALVYGLYDVRGDDPVKLAAYDRLLGERFGGAHPTYFRPLERLDPLWLDRLSVRWVMTAPGAVDENLRSVWHLAYRGGDAEVWERASPLPLARWAGPTRGGAGRVEVLERLPGRFRIAFERGSGPTRAERDPLLVVAESWAPGWSARLDDGTEIPVEAAGDVLLGVRPPVTRGVVTVSYRPPGLVAGAWGSLAGIFALGVMGWMGWRSRQSGGSG